MSTLLSPWADAVIGLGLAFLLIAAAELLAGVVERQVRGGPVESLDRKALHRDDLRYGTDLTGAERAVGAPLSPRRTSVDNLHVISAEDHERDLMTALSLNDPAWRPPSSEEWTPSGVIANA